MSRDRIGRTPPSPSCTLACTNTPTSARKVKGKWFSVALASNEPKFIAKDTDMKFFIHKIQVTPESLQFHFHRK